MPGELYWNAPPPVKADFSQDSDQDTFALLSSSDFETPNSLEERDFNNLSFDITTAMATKYSAGSTDAPGPSGQGDAPRDDPAAAGPSNSRSGLTGHQGLTSGGAGGGDGGDRRDNNRNRSQSGQILEDDSHEPRASGSSTSSGSIPILAPVDPALDINTADLWPSDRNGHSDESGLSQATTATIADSENDGISMQNNSVVNPLLGATSSSSSSSVGSKNVLKSTSAILDISSTTLSTLSSGVSMSSSYDEKKSSSDTSRMDISSDHSVDLLSADGKLGEFNTSQIDIFNNSGERFTSTPAEEIAIMDFHQAELLGTPDDSELVISSTQEELEKTSFVVPPAPIPSTSGILKRKADIYDNNLNRKVPRPTLKLQPPSTISREPATLKKISERALAFDKIGQFLERGLKNTSYEAVKQNVQTGIEETNSNGDVQQKPVDKNLQSTTISRKLLFESSQSSSEPSSSSGESTIAHGVIEATQKNAEENLTAMQVKEACGALISKVLEDLPNSVDAKETGLRAIEKSGILQKESDTAECSESESIIESSQPSFVRSSDDKPKGIITKDFRLRCKMPTLQDVESQYFPFEVEDKLTPDEIDQNVGKLSTDANVTESVNEVPESEMSDFESVEHVAESKDDKDDTGLTILSSVENADISATANCEGDDSKTTQNSQIVDSEDVKIPCETDVKLNELPLSCKRDLEEEIERNADNHHKRIKLNEIEIVTSVSSTFESTDQTPDDLKIPSQTDDNFSDSKNSSRLFQTRDQEVQTLDSSDDKSDNPNDKETKDVCLRRRTVLNKRIVVEEFIRNGRVYKKTTEEFNEDPIVTECYENTDNPNAFVNPQPVNKETPEGTLKSRDSSSCISSTERSGTSSGWLGDLSASASKSSSSSSATKVKVSPKGMTPRLNLSACGTNTSSVSSMGMKTLRSVRRRQFSEFKKTLHLSPDKSVPDAADEVASSTPKIVAETSKANKRDSKGRKEVEIRKTPPAVDKKGNKRKKTNRKPKSITTRITNYEDKSPTFKKKSKSSDAEKTSPPREQLILKLNLKNSSIVSSHSAIEDSRTLKPGVRVMAKYRDGYYYPGRALEQERHDRWRILYDDGDTRSIRVENILVVEFLPVGQSIYVLSQDGFYDSAIITGYVEADDEIQYVIEMDGGSKRQVKHTKVILTTDQAACMEKLPLGTMYGYTSICLDNIIEGKRRSRDLPLDSSSKSSRRERTTSHSTSSANEESDHSSNH